MNDFILNIITLGSGEEFLGGNESETITVKIGKGEYRVLGGQVDFKIRESYATGGDESLIGLTPAEVRSRLVNKYDLKKNYEQAKNNFSSVIGITKWSPGHIQKRISKIDDKLTGLNFKFPKIASMPSHVSNDPIQIEKDFYQHMRSIEFHYNKLTEHLYEIIHRVQKDDNPIKRASQISKMLAFDPDEL